jgi:hypothetical protein
MHTFLYIAYVISTVFAIGAVCFGLALALYASFAILASKSAVVETPTGRFIVGANEITVCWEFPFTFVGVGVVWALIALGLRHLL